MFVSLCRKQAAQGHTGLITWQLVIMIIILPTRLGGDMRTHVLRVCMEQLPYLFKRDPFYDGCGYGRCLTVRIGARHCRAVRVRQPEAGCAYESNRDFCCGDVWRFRFSHPGHILWRMTGLARGCIQCLRAS